MLRVLAGLALVVTVSLLAEDRAADQPSAGKPSAGKPSADKASATSKERLKKLQPLVGAWRGVGQPLRGSPKDSWLESADWGWNFADEQGPSLVAQLSTGRYFTQLRLTTGKQAGTYVLTANPVAGGEAVRYAGQLDEQGQLILNVEQPRDDLPADFPRRISLRFVAGGDRLLVLLEKKAPAGEQLTRLAEVGYTRQGSGFGKNTPQRECVVTGGLGTIEVSHGGKTYYVCCTGCRDYFNESPEKVLEEYAARKQAEKKQP
jgi:hypothetical protein